MRFQYQARQPDGRQTDGRIEAGSARAAQRMLIRQGLQPLAIEQTSNLSPPAARSRRFARGRDRTQTMIEFQALIAGGVPIPEAVAALEQTEISADRRRALADLTMALRRGDRFCQAFEAHLPDFPPYIHRIVEAGETSGRLPEALADAVEQLRADDQSRRELQSALVYPAVLMIFGSLAVLFMTLFVIPRFAAMFEGKLDRLPTLSAIVIRGGMWVHDHILALALAASLSAAALYRAARSARARQHIYGAACKIPGLRLWFQEVDAARWSAILARLLENRVPLMQALPLARSVVRNAEAQAALRQSERTVRAGKPLAEALADSGFLPPTTLSLIRVGERSGALPKMVRSAASIFHDRVKARTKAVLTIVEPLAILLIGAVIGLVAVAIFSAITSINDVTGL